jgi:hypothetical protein
MRHAAMSQTIINRSARIGRQSLQGLEVALTEIFPAEELALKWARL